MDSNILKPFYIKSSSSQPELLSRFPNELHNGSRASSANAQINAQPQDYVVVDGKNFRMNRSPRGNISSIERGVSPPGGLIDRNSNVSENIESLKNDLAKANIIISRQKIQIENLTQQLNLDYVGDILTNKKDLGSLNGMYELGQGNISSRPSSSASARRRAEAMEIAQKLPSLPDVGTHLSSKPLMTKSLFCSDVLSVKTGHRPSSTSSNSPQGSCSSPVRLEEDFITPTNESASINQFSGKTTIKKHSTDNFEAELSNVHLSPPPLHSQSVDTPLGGTTTPGSVGPPKGLAARLAMGSQERRKLVTGVRRKLPKNSQDSPSNPSGQSLITGSPTYGEEGTGLDHARMIETDYEPCSSPLASFNWKSKKRGDVYLFIAHDNPQVGDTVATRLKTEGPMHIMLESKEDSGLVCFLLASIVYSGCIEDVEGADLENPRGSQYIVCSNMSALKADIATLPTRTKGDILEVDLEYAGQQGRVDVSSKELVASFLRRCTARVDVILDPSHTQMWYPYWEGRRKMAPQFRSQGVGYIRLGDDMSNYGSAFLSLDAGATYLDDGATSIVVDKRIDPALSRTFPGGLVQPTDYIEEKVIHLTSIIGKLAPGVKPGRKKSFNNEYIRSDSTDENDSSTVQISSSTKSSSTSKSRVSLSLNKELEEVREALQLLSDPDYKWAERVAALRRLHTVVINISAISCNSYGGTVNGSSDIPPTLLTEIISALTLCVTRQKNPHVLRSAVCCVRVVGAFAASTVSCGVAWRALLLETIHLLRVSNKPVYEESKDTLVGLQCGAAGAARWTISMHHLTPMIPDILAGPRGKGSGGASNSSKVVQWLEGMVCNEIDSYIESMYCRHEGLEGPKPSDRVDIGGLFTKCQQLLIHREEVTREAAVALAGSFLVYDILQSGGPTGWKAIFTLNTLLNNQNRSCPIAMKSLSANKVHNEWQSSPVDDIFIGALSPNIISSLNELARQAQRMHERVLGYAISLLGTKVIEMDASRRCSIENTGGSSSDSLQSGIAFVEKDPLKNANFEKCKNESPDSTHKTDNINTNIHHITADSNNTESNNISETIDDKNATFNSRKKSINMNGDLDFAAMRINLNKDNSNSDAINDLIIESLGICTKYNTNLCSKVDETGMKRGGEGERGRRSSDKEQEGERSEEREKLSKELFEVNLILREPLPTSREGWATFLQVVNDAPQLYDDLNAAAVEGKMPRGQLLRMVLPFGEDTNSSDQSHIKNNCSSSSSSDVKKGTQPGIDEGIKGLNLETVLSLRKRLVALRRLIRVKLADEADLQQAMSATSMLQQFCTALEKLAKFGNFEPYFLVMELDGEG